MHFAAQWEESNKKIRNQVFSAKITRQFSAYSISNTRISNKKTNSNHEWNLQLNEYETAPCFIQLNQKLTSDCLLISVYLPGFTGFCMMCSRNCSADQNKTIL